jgi:uncharacterized repeat protein (TIGR02543 family)
MTTQMIETYQISWYLDTMWGYNYSHKNDYAGLVEALKPSNRAKNGIVAVSVYDRNGGGHAVVLHDITETASEYVISYYNNWYIGTINYLYISKNNPSMRFSDSSMETRYGTAYGLTNFYFVTSSEVRNSMLVSPKGSGNGMLLTVNSKDVIVVDASNNPVPESCKIPPAPDSTSESTFFSLPAGEYSIRAIKKPPIMGPLSAVDEPFIVSIGDDDSYIRLSCDSSDFDATFKLGDAPNLLLSNVSSAIDVQITSTNIDLNMDSLHVSNVAPGEYEISFFGPSSEPGTDVKQMSFRIGEEPQTYAVTFNADNGTENSIKIVTKGEKVEKPADPKKDGYKFIGWFDGETEFDFDTPITGDLTLIAHWEKSDIMYGDVNGDGRITAADATMLLQYLAEWDLGDSINLANADVNGDGRITAADATLLLQYLAEWDVTLGPRKT